MSARAVFWGVPQPLQALFYLAAGAAVLLFAYGLWRRLLFWSEGKDDDDFNGADPLRLLILATRTFFSPDCILARRSFGLAAYRGIMLLFIIWGFTTLFIGTVLLTVHHYTIPFLVDRPYLFFSLAMDAAGAVLLTGLVISILRRHLVARVRRVTSAEDLLFLYLLLLIVITGFGVEGWRLAATNPPGNDLSPIGALFGRLLVSSGLIRSLGYTYLWTVHVSSVLTLIALLPYSKFFHIIASQLTVARAKYRYGGAYGSP